jgi:putative chitinase
MDLTKEQLAKLIPGNQNLDNWYDALVKIMPDYDINTPLRIAHFLAQCSHESAKFTAISENLYYKKDTLRRVFKKYFPTDELAAVYAMNPEKIANHVYANRMGNGSESSGDGYRYRGRGILQLTGKENYNRFADSIGMSLDDVVEYMNTFEGCVQSACDFWERNKLNKHADADDIVTITKIINGGTNGIDDREDQYALASSILLT